MKVTNITINRAVSYGSKNLGAINVDITLEAGEKMVDVINNANKALDGCVEEMVKTEKARMDAIKAEIEANRKPENKLEALNIEVDGKALKDYSTTELETLKTTYGTDTRIGFGVRLILGEVQVRTEPLNPDAGQTAKKTNTNAGGDDLAKLLATKVGEKLVRGGNHTIGDCTKRELAFITADSFKNEAIKGKARKAVALGFAPAK